jgi:hypothetical protein
MPRVHNNKTLQQSRLKEMAEVFTPSWVRNAQNNLIDNTWFGRENIFNFEINVDGKRTWNLNFEKITFPDDKTWKRYVSHIRIEIPRGELP